MKLCLASGNAHKAREFQALAQAGGLSLEIVSAREACGGMPHVDEDTGTFIGNARKKARALMEKLRGMECGDSSPPSTARAENCGPMNRPVESGDESPHSKYWVMADDSGVCVDALGGAPGVESAYYAGPQGDSAANLQKLVREMRGVPEGGRGAHYICVLVLLSPDGAEHVFEGRCHGTLAHEPRGEGGFGYDPFFVPEGFAQTLAELGDELKNTFSHRGRAWEKAQAYLRSLP